jgi:hypothetical protein
MALSIEAVRQVDLRLRRDAEILVHEIRSLADEDAQRAGVICTEIIALLRKMVVPETDVYPKLEHPPSAEAPIPFRATSRPGAGDGTGIEDFILSLLAQCPRGMSVQEVVDNLDEADMPIKRPTLVVRLHRMVQAGKLTKGAHGHYELSEAEHNRRQSA